MGAVGLACFAGHAVFFGPPGNVTGTAAGAMDTTPPCPAFGEGGNREPPSFPVPDHELLRRIGRGAYGEVWLARSMTGAFRAVKIVRRATFGHDRPFEREFEGILKFEPISRSHESQMDILHVGRARDGFYCIMELADDQVSGRQIDPDTYSPRTLKSDLLAHQRLPFADCVRIAIGLTTALEHLHAHGLVHRDIKPSNVVFIDGVPKLADIGLVTGLEATRSVVGTEGFTAPEGSGTPGADLYSLGKVLYEMATGKDRQEFPSLPTRLRELPDQEGLLELNAVIAKACRHDPRDRYPSAAAMRTDLELLEAGRSLARLHRTQDRLRIAQRLGAVASLLAALVALGWWWQIHQARRLRAVAAAEERERRRAQENLYLADVQLAYQDWKAGQLSRTLARLHHHVPRTNEPDLRGWEWYYLVSLCHGDARTIQAATNGILAMSGHPDSARLAVAGTDGHVRLFDIADGRQLVDLAAHHAPACAVAWNPDGDRLASGGRDGRLVVWDAATFRPRHVLGGEAEVFSVVWSPDGTRVAAGGLGHLDRDVDGLVTIWDAATGRRLHRFVGQVGQIRTLAWHPRGDLLAVGENFLGRIQIWHTGTGELARTLSAHGHFLAALAWSPDGRQLASASYDQTIKVWDADTWKATITLDRPHQGQPTSLAWSADGAWLVSGGVDGLVKVWDPRSGICTNVLRGHLAAARAVLWWDPTGQVLSAAEDGSIKFWNPRAEPAFRLVAGRGGCAWSPDGRWLATGDAPGVAVDRQGAIRILDVTTWDPVVTLPRPGELAPFCLAWSPDSRWLAAGFGDRRDWGYLEVWDWQERRRRPGWESAHDGHQVRSVAWSPDGRRLASGGSDYTAILWNAPSGTQRLRFREHSMNVGTVTWNPNGPLLASRDFNGHVLVWDEATGHVRARLLSPGVPAVDHPRGVDWSPQGDALAAGSGDGTVMVWETATWRVRYALRGHTANVRSVAWSPDGRRLVSAAEDQTIRIWDAGRGLELLVLPSLSNRLPGVSWSPSGRRIAVAGHETFVFDASLGYERAPSFAPEGAPR